MSKLTKVIAIKLAVQTMEVGLGKIKVLQIKIVTWTIH